MEILIEAFGLGLIGGVVPGAVLTILLVSVMQGGFRAGLRAFLWSLAAELSVVSGLLIIVFALPIPREIFNYIGLVGSLVLCYFAWQIFHIQKIDQPDRATPVFSSRKIYALALTNAPLYVFWITVCVPLIFQLGGHWSLPVSVGLFMTMFEVGWALSTFSIMLLFVKGRQYVTNAKSIRKVYVILSIIMFLLGIKMLYISLGSLLVKFN